MSWKNPIKPKNDPLGILEEEAPANDPLGILEKKSPSGNGLSDTSKTKQTQPEVGTLQSQGEDLSGKRPAAYPLPQKPSGFSVKPNLTVPKPEEEKYVAPDDFLAHLFGVDKEKFAPERIYDNASNFIAKDIDKNPAIYNAPYPQKLKEQIIKGDGNINIQGYTTQRVSAIQNQQDDILRKIAGESFVSSPDSDKIKSYRTQIEELEKEKDALKVNAGELNDIQAVTLTPPPADATNQTDYFRQIGRNVKRLNDPIGIANQEKHEKDGTNIKRDKELVDTENYANEQAGIEAKKKQLSVAFGNRQISQEELGNQLGDIKIAEDKLLSNNPGAKAVMDRNALSKIIEEDRRIKNAPESNPDKIHPFSGTLFHDIINYTASDDEVKDAIKKAREQGYSISQEEEKKYIADKSQIPGTSALGNLVNSSIVSLATSINNYNPFLSNEEIEGEKYRVGKIFQPVQRQTEGAIGYVNQTANVVGTVLKWATLGKFLGAGADAALGARVGAAGAEGLGAVKKLSEVQAHIAGTALTAGILVYPEAKEEAKQFTDDEAKQDAYAGTITLLNTLAFTSLNPEGIVNKILGNVVGKSNFSKEFLKSIDEAGGINKLKPEAYKATIVNGLKAAMGANLSATATMTILDMAQQATDVMFDKKPQVDMQEVAKEAVNSFISFAPLSILQGRGAALAEKSNRNTTIQIINQAATDPIAFKNYMDNAVQEGAISRKDANRKIQIVSTHADLKNSENIPQHLSEENKALYSDNLRQEMELELQKKNIVDPIQLKDKNDQIKALQEERKSISGMPVKEPSKDQQTEEILAGRTAHFQYNNENEVPEIFKDHISSTGETNGKKFVRVTVAQSLANYALAPNKAGEISQPMELNPKNTAIGLSHGDWLDRNKSEFTPEKYKELHEGLLSPDEEVKGKAIDEIVVKKEEMKKFAPPEATEQEKLIQAYRDKTKVTKDAASDDVLLKNISEQAQNISGGEINKTGNAADAMRTTIEQAGEDLVEAAMTKYPAKSLLKPAEETAPKSTYRTEGEAQKILNEKVPFMKNYKTDVEYHDIVTGETKSTKTHKAKEEMVKRYSKLKELIVNCLT